jgi:hypothetical protein
MRAYKKEEVTKQNGFQKKMGFESKRVTNRQTPRSLQTTGDEEGIWKNPMR